jgi:hypothetical protein
MDTHMGHLNPGATLIYERVGDITYSRESGSDPLSRVEVGYEYDPRTSDGRPLRDHLQDSVLWGKIRRLAETHPGMQAELERVIMFYRLLEETNDEVMYHPV